MATALPQGEAKESWCREKLDFVCAVVNNVDRNSLKSQLEICETEDEAEAILQSLLWLQDTQEMSGNFTEGAEGTAGFYDPNSERVNHTSGARSREQPSRFERANQTPDFERANQRSFELEQANQTLGFERVNQTPDFERANQRSIEFAQANQTRSFEFDLANQTPGFKHANRTSRARSLDQPIGFEFYEHSGVFEPQRSGNPNFIIERVDIDFHRPDKNNTNNDNISNKPLVMDMNLVESSRRKNRREFEGEREEGESDDYDSDDNDDLEVQIDSGDLDERLNEVFEVGEDFEFEDKDESLIEVDEEMDSDKMLDENIDDEIDKEEIGNTEEDREREEGDRETEMEEDGNIDEKTDKEQNTEENREEAKGRNEENREEAKGRNEEIQNTEENREEMENRRPEIEIEEETSNENSESNENGEIENDYVVIDMTDVREEIEIRTSADPMSEGQECVWGCSAEERENNETQRNTDGEIQRDENNSCESETQNEIQNSDDEISMIGMVSGRRVLAEITIESDENPETPEISEPLSVEEEQVSEWETEEEEEGEDIEEESWFYPMQESSEENIPELLEDHLTKDTRPIERTEGLSDEESTGNEDRFYSMREGRSEDEMPPLENDDAQQSQECRIVQEGPSDENITGIERSRDERDGDIAQVVHGNTNNGDIAQIEQHGDLNDEAIARRILEREEREERERLEADERLARQISEELTRQERLREVEDERLARRLDEELNQEPRPEADQNIEEEVNVLGPDIQANIFEMDPIEEEEEREREREEREHDREEEDEIPPIRIADPHFFERPQERIDRVNERRLADDDENLAYIDDEARNDEAIARELEDVEGAVRPPRADTSGDEELARRLEEEENRIGEPMDDTTSRLLAELISIFPDADPQYLRERCEGDIQFDQLVLELIDLQKANPRDPRMCGHPKRQQECGAENTKRQRTEMPSSSYYGEGVAGASGFETFECTICFEEHVPASHMATCNSLKKSHFFCIECVRKHVGAQIGLGNNTFRCMNGYCEAEFSWSMLGRVMEPQVLKKVQERRQAEEVERAGIEDLVACPFCNFMVIMPDQQNRILECLNPECQKESCRQCRRPSHIPLRCEEVEYDNQKDARVLIENKMSEAMIRTCPNCKKSIVSVGGCNRMTCTCGTVMCYVCKQAIASGYDHFSTGQCPQSSNLDQLHTSNVRDAASRAREELDPDVNLVHDPTQGIL